MRVCNDFLPHGRGRARLMNRTVYLAGPIGGIPFDDAWRWRSDATTALRGLGFSVLNPICSTEIGHLAGKENCPINLKSHGVKNSELFYKDIHKIKEASVVLANLAGYNEKSFGTPFEMGFAYGLGKTCVCVTDKERFDHPFISVPSVCFLSLEEALSFICELY
jgi:nucleoside 2-deoxyribosyltransferase